MLTLSACNAVYQRPTSAPGGTANVRFIAPQHKGLNSAVSLYVHDGEKCGIAPRKVVAMGGFGNFGGGRDKDADMGMPKDPEGVYELGQYYETAVVAGTRLNFTAAGGEVGYGVCYVSGSFLPEANGEYEITYRTGSGYCYVNVDRIGKQDAGFYREGERSMMQRPESCTGFWN